MKKMLLIAIVGILASTNAMAACEGARSNDEYTYCQAQAEKNPNLCGPIGPWELRRQCITEAKMREKQMGYEMMNGRAGETPYEREMRIKGNCESYGVGCTNQRTMPRWPWQWGNAE